MGISYIGVFGKAASDVNAYLLLNKETGYLNTFLIVYYVLIVSWFKLKIYYNLLKSHLILFIKASGFITVLLHIIDAVLNAMLISRRGINANYSS